MTTQSHPDNVVRWLAEAQRRIREPEHERSLLPKPVIVNLALGVSDDEDAVTCELVGDAIVLDGKYPISLSRCDTPLKLLDWVHHLLEKEWGTPSLVRRFLALACETHGINFHWKA